MTQPRQPAPPASFKSGKRSKFGSAGMVATRAASPKAKGSKPVTLAKLKFTEGRK